ncbi:MAG: hypothetical protein AAB152_01930, partial [Candidatus Coatesbacteria bacterium]
VAPTKPRALARGEESGSLLGYGVLPALVGMRAPFPMDLWLFWFARHEGIMAFAQGNGQATIIDLEPSQKVKLYCEWLRLSTDVGYVDESMLRIVLTRALAARSDTAIATFTGQVLGLWFTQCGLHYGSGSVPYDPDVCRRRFAVYHDVLLESSVAVRCVVYPGLLEGALRQLGSEESPCAEKVLQEVLAEATQERSPKMKAGLREVLGEFVHGGNAKRCEKYTRMLRRAIEEM